MNKFEIFFIRIVIILSLSAVIVLVLLRHDQYVFVFKNFFSNMCSVTHQVDIQDFREEFGNEGYEIRLRIYDIVICFFDFICMLFNDFIVFCKNFRICSFDQCRKMIVNAKNYLINKLMHQSSNVLDFELIMNTVNVVRLDTKRSDQVYWVIQLGALRNFQNVLEVVYKLKMHDYPVYICPEYATNGDLVRIFIGPCSSREYLESLLDDLYRLSMLRGKIYFY